jgi:hypothetical protein
MSNNGAATLEKISQMVQQHFSEEIWRATKIGIGIIASLSLKERDNCLVLVFEGTSGKGKSTVVRLLMSDRAETEKWLHRVDDFTPAAFVSHAANRKVEQLKKIDLLPQIKNKLLLTKELAPLFRDDEKEMRQNFARLTSILDGNGYKSASGSHGLRGYEGRYAFNWIGATTPIPNRTHKIMAQLGNRILFYELSSDEPTEDELMDFAQNHRMTALTECEKLVNDFIEGHFNKHPVESFDPKAIEISEDLQRQIIRYSLLIARGRVEFENNGLSDPEIGTPEGPQRLILLLQTLARGLALSEGRFFVNEDDLELIRHIAFSSIPRKRRELLRIVLLADGRVTSTEVKNSLGISPVTAHERMKELAATGIVDYMDGISETSTPAKIYLADKWQWLLEGIQSGDFTPFNETRPVSINRYPPLTV